MSEYKDITIESDENSGKIVFAEDVVATIATLAASEVEGVYGMSGSAFEGIGEKLGKKNYTKGIKVEVGSVECAVDTRGRWPCAWRGNRTRRWARSRWPDSRSGRDPEWWK